MLSPSAIPLFLRTSLFKTINVKERRDPDSHREKRQERGNVDGGRVMGGQKGEARGGGQQWEDRQLSIPVDQLRLARFEDSL